MSKDVILTGLRANSEFHIGNYLGAILPVVELQQRHAGEYQVNMFVPDLHSFTTPVDHSKLYDQIIDNLRVFVAGGLNLEDADTYIYRQSFIPAHSEMTWILDCFASFGQLKRMTQFKDKVVSQTKDIGSVQHKIQSYVGTFNVLRTYVGSSDRSESEKAALNNNLKLMFDDLEQLMESEFLNSTDASVGLYNYPVLMAADILLYGAKYIPVGEDQRQHIELTRDLAIRLNNKFEQQLFTVPEPWDKQLAFANRENGVRIRSLRNPSKKMSKSVDDPSGTILLSDNPDEAAKKIMRAETDSHGEIRFDMQERPGISNLLQLHALLSGKPQHEVNTEWEGRQTYGELKKAVADSVQKFLTDFQAKLANVDEQTILDKLAQDEAKMNEVANKTLYGVQEAVGLRK